VKEKFVKFVLLVSVIVNIVIAIPATSLLFGSEQIRAVLYQGVIAPKIGRADVVFIGDSLTERGMLWAERLGRIDLISINLGRAQFMTRQMGNQVSEAIRMKAKLAFVMAGTNDEDKSVKGATETFETYRTVILEPLLAAGVQPIIELTLYRENDRHPEFVDALNDLLRRYAEDRNIQVIDLNQKLCERRSLKAEFSLDGLHLTPKAYDVWASEVRAVINKI
jgi:hypothetical protein